MEFGRAEGEAVVALRGLRDEAKGTAHRRLESRDETCRGSLRLQRRTLGRIRR